MIVCIADKKPSVLALLMGSGKDTKQNVVYNSVPSTVEAVKYTPKTDRNSIDGKNTYSLTTVAKNYLEICANRNLN